MPWKQTKPIHKLWQDFEKVMINTSTATELELGMTKKRISNIFMKVSNLKVLFYELCLESILSVTVF